MKDTSWGSEEIGLSCACKEGVGSEGSDSVEEMEFELLISSCLVMRFL